MLKQEHTPTNLTGWKYARGFLGELYECKYLADTWPERLGIDDIAALQAAGKPHPVFEAWSTCLRKAAESVELVTCKEFWWLGSDEPSEYWTRKKQRKILIPPCHKPQEGDDILFFGGGALERTTVSPQDFADYLQEIGEQPSKYIAAWFDAYDVDMTAAEPIEPEPTKNKPRKKRIPQERDTNEGLLLITNLLDYYKIEYLDELPASKAWGKIVSGEFTSELMKIGENKKHIMLNGDGKLDKSDFLERYRKRFK